MDVKKTTKEELNKLLTKIRRKDSDKIALLEEKLLAQEEVTNQLLEEMMTAKLEGQNGDQKATSDNKMLQVQFDSLEEAYEKMRDELHARDQQNLALRGHLLRTINKLSTQTTASNARNAGDQSTNSGPPCAKKAKFVVDVEEQQQDVKFASSSSLGPINSSPSNVGPMEQMHFQLEKMCGEVTSNGLNGLKTALQKLIANSDLAAAAFNAANMDISHENNNSSKDDADSGVHDGKEEEEDNEHEAMGMDVHGHGHIGQEASQNAMQSVGQYLGDHRAETNASLGSTIATGFINYFQQYCFNGVSAGKMTAEMAVQNFLSQMPINFVQIAADEFVELVKKQMAMAARFFVEAAKRNAEKNA